MFKVALCQSNYIPWKGYFDLISRADLFVFHDDVQYTKHDWRNRNRIKTPEGVRWLTIPVGTDEHRRVCDVVLPDGRWQAEHWRRICRSYGDTPFFDVYRAELRKVYVDREWASLSELNQHLIRAICRWLGIGTAIDDSRRFELNTNKGDRVLELLAKTGATHYVSGPAARTYLNLDEFERRSIEVEWMDYSRYPVYDQIHPPFRHDVTVLDLLFHLGEKARSLFIRPGRENWPVRSPADQAT